MRSDKEIALAENALAEFLRPTLRLTEDELDKFLGVLGDYVTEIAKHYASDALDREFNRGDYRG